MPSKDIYSNLITRLIEYRESNPRLWTSKILDTQLKSDLESVTEYSNLPLNQKAAALILGKVPLCECGNALKFDGKKKQTINGTPYGGWLEFCSAKCSRTSQTVVSRRKQSIIEKYGVDSWAKTDEAKQIASQLWSQEKKDQFNEKAKQTYQLKYGADHYSKTDEFKQKVIETTLQQTNGKYTNHFQDVNKIKQSNLAKYGVDSFSKTDLGRHLLSVNNAMKRVDIALKSKLNRMSKQQYSKELYDILIAEDMSAFQVFINNIAQTNKFTHRHLIAEYIKISYSYLNNLMRKYDMNNDYLSLGTSKSYKEYQVMEYVLSLGVNAKSDRTVLEGKEIDILIESHKLGIEFDGLKYHSVFLGGKDKFYHSDKTNMAESKGYQLLHIFENEWDNLIKREIWKSIIKSKLGLTDNTIYARKCTVQDIDSKTAREFFDNNHLSGFIGAETHTGLFYNGELVSAISYGKSRFDKTETELYRFASKIHTQVVGGFGKLFKTIPNKDKLISYADRRISGVDSVYNKFFNNCKVLPPSWSGFKQGTNHLQHRLSFTKRKVMEMAGNDYDNSKPAMDNLFNINYDIIYDCGNWKYY